MEIPVLISVAGTQRFAGMESETIELVTNGTKVTLRRTGKVNSTMVFVLGQKDESLYDCGAGALMIGVCATQMTVLLNERGGVLDLEYSIELERSVSATNLCHVEVRPAATAVIE